MSVLSADPPFKLMPVHKKGDYPICPICDQQIRRNKAFYDHAKNPMHMSCFKGLPLTQARENLADQYEVDANHLKFTGIFRINGQKTRLLLFEVTDPQNPRYQSTLSFKYPGESYGRKTEIPNGHCRSH